MSGYKIMLLCVLQGETFTIKNNNHEKQSVKWMVPIVIYEFVCSSSVII